MSTDPVTIVPNASILEAAKLIKEKKIGSVIVIEKGKIIGIVTERDLVRRVLAENKDPKSVKVSDIMSISVVSISPEQNVLDAAYIMRRKGIRRLVVKDKERLVGVITSNDLVRDMNRAVEELATMLYLYGRNSTHTSKSI